MLLFDQFRAASVVPGRLAAIEKAYLDRDFETFGRITMQDSNQFHACCADTYPPIFYMNDVSRRIVRVIHSINDEAKAVLVRLGIACYSFDSLS
jgi:diphosphomevalonate decarboxylase